MSTMTTPVAPLSEQDEISIVEKAFAETPRMEGLSSIRIEVADDEGTAPALWVYFRFNHPVDASSDFVKRYSAYTIDLQKRIWQAGSDRLLRSRFEQAA